jgi:hypothetical protein
MGLINKENEEATTRSYLTERNPSWEANDHPRSSAALLIELK